MSEGIFGKDADLAQRLKDRIAFHANEHRHTYEIGKGVMDALVLDLLADFRDAGGVILPVKPNGTVWLIRRRRVVSATVMFVGAGADGLTSFSYENERDLFDRALVIERGAAATLTSVKGLGRKWSWESLIDAYEEEKALDAAQISLFDFVETTGGCICGAPCGCYDG